MKPGDFAKYATHKEAFAGPAVSTFRKAFGRIINHPSTLKMIRHGGFSAGRLGRKGIGAANWMMDNPGKTVLFGGGGLALANKMFGSRQPQYQMRY